MCDIAWDIASGPIVDNSKYAISHAISHAISIKMRYRMRYRMIYRMRYPYDAISNGFPLRYRVRYSHLCLLCVLAQAAAAMPGSRSSCSSCLMLVVCIAELQVDALDASLRGLAALGMGIMCCCSPVAGENGMWRPGLLVSSADSDKGWRNSMALTLGLGRSPGVGSSSSSDWVLGWVVQVTVY